MVGPELEPERKEGLPLGSKAGPEKEDDRENKQKY